MRGIDELDVGGKTVLLRADMNVPLAGTQITDDGRIRASLPTIIRLAERGARILVLAHLGRPSGKDYAERAAGGPSLQPVARRLAELLGQDVPLAGDVAGVSAAGVTASLTDGQVGMAENVRFEPAETSKDEAERAGLARRFAELAGTGAQYAGDGFGALHRKHASVYDLPLLLPHAAGELVEAEVAVLRRLTEDPQRPYVMVLGGAKPSDKLGLIANVLDRVDRLVIGGGMSYTFLKAQGHEVGKSLLEPDQISRVSDILTDAAKRGVEVVLPVDLVAADRFAADADREVVPVGAFPADRESLDMGPATRALFTEKLADAKTVFWNGPVGVFEFPPFAEGTRAVAEAISHVAGLTVVGGGDSAAAVRALGFDERSFGHISTGGGASLEYLEGRTLPGLAALEDGGHTPG